MRHPCLANNAKLNVRRSQNPRPPCLFGLHNCDHSTHASFLELPSPHQNSLIAVSIEWIIFPCRKKQDMMYVGIDCSTALIRTSFPTREMVFSPYPLILFHIRSRITLKIGDFDFPTTEGMPKYLSSFSTTCTPRIWVIWAFCSAPIPALNTIDDLSKLITWPETLAYLSEIPFN